MSLQSPPVLPAPGVRASAGPGKTLHAQWTFCVLPTACRCHQRPERLACSVFCLCHLCKKAGVEELMKAKELMLLNCGVGEDS